MSRLLAFALYAVPLLALVWWVIHLARGCAADPEWWCFLL